MAEVGLVRFAQVALDVAQTTVPRYRTTFSKHPFTQPQWCYLVPHALRGLDFPQSRSAAGRTLRVASRSWPSLGS